MIQAFLEHVFNQRLLVILAFCFIAVWGVYAWQDIPIDAFPDVTNIQVTILTEAPGLAPVEVERQISFPIEVEMNGLPSIREIRSLSKYGLSQVVIIFEDGTDIYWARQLVLERLQVARERIPEGYEPEMGPISTGLGEIYQYSVEGDGVSLMELRSIQDWIIKPQLQTVAGINEVNSFGGFVKQYHVIVDPSKLLKYDLVLRDIFEAIEKNNRNAGGSYIIRGAEQISVRGIGLIETIEDIESVIVAAREGTPIYIRDLADVSVGPETRMGAVTRDGKGEAVCGMTIMLRDSNSKQVVDGVKEKVEEIKKSLPSGVRIDTFYDRTELIQSCVDTVTSALLQGGLLVIVVLFLLIGNLRTAVVVALSLPFSALIAFICLWHFGFTANLMSVGGLAISIGMVVDVSIVMAENIYRHLAEGEALQESKLRICLRAAREVGHPILFAVLIICIVFLPLLTLQEMEGKMFKPLAYTILFAMLGSLVVSLTIVPILSSYLLGSRKKKESFLLHGLKALYIPVLRTFLRVNRLAVVLALVAVMLSALLVFGLGSEFLPQLDEGSIAINIVRFPTASIEESKTSALRMEKLIMGVPEVKTVVSKTGRAEIAEDPMGPEQTDLFIMLRPKSEWRRGVSKDGIVSMIEELLADIPGIRASFSQPIALRTNEIISGIKSDVAIKIFGDTLEVLRAKGEEIERILAEIPGAHDVKVEQIAGFQQLDVVPNRQEIARYGINVDDILEIIETAVGGRVASEVVEGRNRTAILVRFPLQARNDVRAISNILVPREDGGHVPLGRLASFEVVDAPAQISREGSMRRLVVECNIRGRDLGGFVSEARKEVSEKVILDPGYFITWGGQFENQQRAYRRLAIVVPVSLLLIFVLLFTAHSSIKHGLLTMLGIPFALVGGILVIYLGGVSLSVSTAIGFIALFGVAVENGLVMVTCFRQLRSQGLSWDDAIIGGAEMRLRPVLMTTLTTVLGLLPLIYTTGPGAEIQKPVALVVIGGVISSTLLTLFVIPAIYWWFGRDRERVAATASASDATLFGAVAVLRGFASVQQVEECLAEQRRQKHLGVLQRLGELLVSRGYMTTKQVLLVLDQQKNTESSTKKTDSSL